jgi:DNA primase
MNDRRCLEVSRYYPDEFKDHLKARADITQVIGQFVSLQQIGQNWFGQCPFHDDHDPSLLVKPTTNTFSCLSCKAGSKLHSEVQGSDVYSFLKGMLRGNMSDAIEWLAQFLGEPLPVLDPAEQSKVNIRNKWYEYCDQSSKRFTQNLLNNKEAISYLYHRGFNMQDIMMWKLGYGDKNDPDFRNTADRLVFSVFDYHGNIMSFTGRVLLPDNVLKEMNHKLKEEGKSPIVKYLDRYPMKKEDPNYSSHPFPSFDKGQNLYGIHIAKDYMRQWGVAIIVEGWTDVIKMHKHGARHTVATMGVALTETQAQMIKRSGARKVIIMRDGDQAGYSSALRDCKVLEPLGLETLIVPLEEGIDPCTLCDRFGVGNEEDLSRYIDRHQMPLNQFQLKKIFHETQEEILYHHSQIAYYQNARMQKVIAILSDIQDPIDQDIYTRQASELYGISYESIQAQVSHYQRTGNYKVG